MAPTDLARSLLIKPASGDCNLRCCYCFYHDRLSDPYKDREQHRMRPEVLDALIRQGMRLQRDNATFGWQGGEPTLCGLDFFRTIVALQKEYGYAGQSVSNGLQTNGLLLTPEWAEFLHEYNFLLGVSLDGPSAYHDHYRTTVGGSPTHQRVMDVLHMLAEHQVAFNILAVVNRYNADHGAEVFDFLAGEGFGFLQFIPCVEVDPQSGAIADFSVTPEQYGDFMCAVFDRWYNDGDPVISVRDFEATLAVYLGQAAPLCCYQPECGGYLVVEYNGDVYPCDFYVRGDLRVGNIMETPLQRIFDSGPVRQFAGTKAIPRPECGACPWRTLCNQGCPRFVGIAGNGRHFLCRSYQRFYTYAHNRLIALRDRLLTHDGLDPRRAPHIPATPIGRNDPCPCGSGRKYKVCCGQGARA